MFFWCHNKTKKIIFYVLLTSIFRHNPNPNPNRTKPNQTEPNRTKPKTKHLNISKYKIFSNWRLIMLLLFLKVKFWEILIFVWLKVFLNWIWLFFKKLKKNLKNGFLVLPKQSRTKLKDCRKNQNQTITKCFLKFGTKPKSTGISRNFNFN
jgi:hypothetical protein